MIFADFILHALFSSDYPKKYQKSTKFIHSGLCKSEYTVITGLYCATFFLFELLRDVEQVRDICVLITD